MINKSHIIAEIKRTAQQNRGTPLGAARFTTETGIKNSDWEGKIWARWGDAVKEAGFEPNERQGPRDANDLLECLAMLAHELGHFPVNKEIELRARNAPGFPWPKTLRRFGTKRALAARLREFCLAHGHTEVAILCDEVIARTSTVDKTSDDCTDSAAGAAVGYVYLLKSGRYYKVGRSNAVGRRERELAIQLPDEAKVVHSIKTDDPVGIENYWHNRFHERRKNGEWFELSATDIAAFRRRKFQ